MTFKPSQFFSRSLSAKGSADRANPPTPAATSPSRSGDAAAGFISAGTPIPAECGAGDRLRPVLEADPYRHGTVATALGAELMPPLVAATQDAPKVAGPAEKRISVELPDLVQRYRKHENSHLQLGWHAYCWVSAQADRAAAIDQAEAAIVAAGLEGHRVRVDRDIACFWVAALFGWPEAHRLNISIIRALAPLILRNKAAAVETWVLREAYAKQARALWQTIVAAEQKPAAEWVRAQVTQLLPRAQKRANRRISRRILAAWQAVQRLTYAELLSFRADVERRVSELSAKIEPSAGTSEMAMMATG